MSEIDSFLFPYLAETKKHLAGGKYDHDQSSHGRRGSAAGGGKPARMKDGEAWRKSLSYGEEFAVDTWKQWGDDIRAYQRGETGGAALLGWKKGTALSKEFPGGIEEFAGYWEDAKAKAPLHKGTMYRGLGDVAIETAQKWLDEGGIELRNDQSSTIDEVVSQYFLRSNSERRPEIVWKIKGQGVDITGGGKDAESEIVIEKGTKYRIKNVRYYPEYNVEALREQRKLFGWDYPTYLANVRKRRPSLDYGDWMEMRSGPHLNEANDPAAEPAYYEFELEQIG